MEERLNQIYNKIANTLNETIPEQWYKVFLYGEINEDMQTAFFNYYPKGSNEAIYGRDITELFEITEEEFNNQWDKLVANLEELWNEFENNGQEVWTNLTFVLESSGKFKIDYDYTDLSDASPYEGHLIWDYKYLGIIPVDEDDKLIVEEYIKNNKDKVM